MAPNRNILTFCQVFPQWSSFPSVLYHENINLPTYTGCTTTFFSVCHVSEQKNEQNNLILNPFEKLILKITTEVNKICTTLPLELVGIDVISRIGLKHAGLSNYDFFLKKATGDAILM